MDGPGPSTKANAAVRGAAARAIRANRRASGEAVSNTPERQSAPLPQRGQQADDGSAEEDESSQDGDEDEDGKEKPPVYHHQIWEELLKKGSMGGLLRYVNAEPEIGSDPMDTTAVESTQIHWDMGNRTHWPTNITLWNRPTPWVNPTYEIGIMKYKGRVVLDYAGNPIRNFRIPLTVSSKVEGLRIESWMRSDERLTLGDIEARVWTKTGSNGGRVPVYDKRALSKRASNARTRAGLISWVRKRGRQQQTDFMNDFRTKEQKDRNLASDKDLTPEQQAKYSLMGLNQNKISQAPTRNARIEKIKRTAAGTGGAVAGPSSGAANAGPSVPVAAASEDDDSATDDTDSDEAVQETQICDQASEDDTDDEGSISSSLLDPLDSRHDQPMTRQEVAWLRDALGNTVEEFFFLTEQEPQLANPGDNYFSQWAMLQEQFRILWTATGNTVDAPRLQARGRWTGGISQYYLAEEVEGVAYDG